MYSTVEATFQLFLFGSHEWFCNLVKGMSKTTRLVCDLLLWFTQPVVIHPLQVISWAFFSLLHLTEEICDCSGLVKSNDPPIKRILGINIRKISGWEPGLSSIRLHSTRINGSCDSGQMDYIKSINWSLSAWFLKILWGEESGSERWASESHIVDFLLLDEIWITSISQSYFSLKRKL